MPNNWPCPSYHWGLYQTSSSSRTSCSLQQNTSAQLRKAGNVDSCRGDMKRCKIVEMETQKPTEMQRNAFLKKGGFFSRHKKKHELWHQLPRLKNPQPVFMIILARRWFSLGELLNLGSQDFLFFYLLGKWTKSGLGWANFVKMRFGTYQLVSIYLNYTNLSICVLVVGTASCYGST